MPDFLVPIVIGVVAGLVLYPIVKKYFPDSTKF